MIILYIYNNSTRIEWESRSILLDVIALNYTCLPQPPATKNNHTLHNTYAFKYLVSRYDYERGEDKH